MLKQRDESVQLFLVITVKIVVNTIVLLYHNGVIYFIVLKQLKYPEQITSYTNNIFIDYTHLISE